MSTEEVRYKLRLVLSYSNSHNILNCRWLKMWGVSMAGEGNPSKNICVRSRMIARSRTHAVVFLCASSCKRVLKRVCNRYFTAILRGISQTARAIINDNIHVDARLCEYSCYFALPCVRPRAMQSCVLCFISLLQIVCLPLLLHYHYACS